MADVKLDLLENSIDSLNEALAKYRQGKEGDANAFKFCVQHTAHFLELILKYYVTKAHPLLIYKNPFAKKIDTESQTIGLYEAINFLKNEGRTISDKFETDITWLKKLRNNIEHHKFTMDVNEVDETIGRLMSAVTEFDESHDNIDISSYISADQYELFNALAKTYERKLDRAELAVRVAEEEAYKGCRPKEYDSVNFNIYHCYECDHDTMIPEDNSCSGYRCTFCGNEDSDEIEVDCGGCGVPWPVGEMTSIDFDDSGHTEYRCPHCMHDPEYVRDED